MHLGYAADGWTRRRAEQELQNVLADVRRGIWQPPLDPVVAAAPREVPTFHEFASEWFEGQKVEGGRNGKGLTPAGAADLEWRLTHHLLPVFAAKRLDEITIEDVDRYRRSKVQEAQRRREAISKRKPLRDRDGRILRPLGTTSINKTLTTLGAILEVALEYELVNRNVTKGKRRRLPAVKPQRTWLDRADHMPRCSTPSANSTPTPAHVAANGARCWPRSCSQVCGSGRPSRCAGETSTSRAARSRSERRRPKPVSGR